MINENQRKYLCEHFKLALETHESYRIFRQTLVGAMCLFLGMSCVFFIYHNVLGLLVSVVFTLLFIIMSAIFSRKNKNNIDNASEEFDKIMEELI